MDLSFWYYIWEGPGRRSGSSAGEDKGGQKKAAKVCSPLSRSWLGWLRSNEGARWVGRYGTLPDEEMGGIIRTPPFAYIYTPHPRYLGSGG